MKYFIIIISTLVTLTIPSISLSKLTCAAQYPDISPHKGIYGTARLDDEDTGQLKLQAGFKYPILKSCVYFSYSAKSLWDIQDESGPFEDINHNPELFLITNKKWLPYVNNHLVETQIGYEHESNGVDDNPAGPTGQTNKSRSINNIYIQPKFLVRNNLLISPKLWWNFDKEDNNSDIEDFYGNLDLTIQYHPYKKDKNNSWLVTSKIRGNPNTGKGRIDLDISIPMTWPEQNAYWFIQYFNGYGEVLLGYNDFSESLRVGIMLKRR